MIAPFVRIAHSVVYRINPVLPQAYDDSLSYFEVLARLQKKINELIDAVNALEDAVEELDTRLTTVENKIEEIIENVNSIDDRVKYLEEHPYVLPIATDTVLGGVKIGEGITRQADGTISVEGGGSPYVLPTMDEDTKGGARLGEGLVITDTDKLDVDVDNLDLSNNSSIVNIENNIDEIENNIEALDTDITNIISGDTPVPSTYELPTMDEDTKGGAILGDGLVVDDDTLSVDADNLDLSNNETITNIIDGTTQIDISNNETIQDIISGETPVPFVLPTMSTSTKGGAKVGEGLKVENDILSVTDMIKEVVERGGKIFGGATIPDAPTQNFNIGSFPKHNNAIISLYIDDDNTPYYTEVVPRSPLPSDCEPCFITNQGDTTGINGATRFALKFPYGSAPNRLKFNIYIYNISGTLVHSYDTYCSYVIDIPPGTVVEAGTTMEYGNYQPINSKYSVGINAPFVLGTIASSHYVIPKPFNYTINGEIVTEWTLAKEGITNNTKGVSTLTTNVGDINELTTQNKTSIVDAINELVTRIEALEGG